jgi:hypothetical protein
MQPELERASIRTRAHFALRLVFWGVIVPIAVLVLVFIAYMVVYVGVEHY